MTSGGNRWRAYEIEVIRSPYHGLPACRDIASPWAKRSRPRRPHVQGGMPIGGEVQRDGDALATEVNVLKDGATMNFIVTEDGKVSDGFEGALRFQARDGWRLRN